MGVASPAQEEPREPIRGANVFKLPPTDHDSARVICLVGGSPFDSVRPRQTHCPCLGVKGSQVRILSSRRPSEARCSWGLAQVSGLFSSRVVPALSIYTAGVWGPFVDHLWTPRGFRGATRAGTRCAVPGPGARRKWVQDRGWWLCGCGRAVRSSAKGKRGPREIRCVPRSRTRRSHGASHAGHVGKTRPSLPFANRKRLSFSI